MVCSEGLSSRQSQAKSGLAAWMIIMEVRPRGWGDEEGSPYPLLRNKSPQRWRRGRKIVKNSTLRCKVAEKTRQLGERLRTSRHGAWVSKDLRTAQPPHFDVSVLALSRRTLVC